MSALVRYEEMRGAVERCARIDEAADIRDKAAALAAYARQRDDADLAVWTQEIKLRASVRIGELVRELDTAQGERSDMTSSQHREEVPATKAKAIAEAGLSKSEAYRYQDLAGPRDQQAQKAGKAAAELYFAGSRATKTPPTMAGLKDAVRTAVHATVGPPAPRARPKPIPSDEPPVNRAIGTAWIDFVTAIEAVGKIGADLNEMAGFSPALHGKMLAEARKALPRLTQWIAILESASDETRTAA